MARPLEVEWQDTAETLYSHYKRAKDAQDRTRLQALWRVRQGNSLQEAAETVGVHPVSVGRWLDWYKVVLRRCSVGATGGVVDKQPTSAPKRRKGCSSELRRVRCAASKMA